LLRANLKNSLIASEKRSNPFSIIILPNGFWFLPLFVSMMKKPPFFDEKRWFFDSKKVVFLITNRRLAESKQRKAKFL